MTIIRTFGVSPSLGRTSQELNCIRTILARYGVTLKAETAPLHMPVTGHPKPMLVLLFPLFNVILN